MNDQEAFDENLDDVVESEAIKKALEEPEKIVETDRTFKREMVAFDQIHRFLSAMMSDAIKETGGYVESLEVLEEQLTPAEYFTLEAFYKWVEERDCSSCEGTGAVLIQMSEDVVEKDFCPHCEGGRTGSRNFGSGNYQERYNEWLATLPNIELGVKND